MFRTARSILANTARVAKSSTARIPTQTARVQRRLFSTNNNTSILTYIPHAFTHNEASERFIAQSNKRLTIKNPMLFAYRH